MSEITEEQYEKENLLPCPFCGVTGPAKIATSQDLKGPECGSESDFTIVCDAQKSGCGATCGYAASKERAIQKWNRRGKSMHE